MRKRLLTRLSVPSPRVRAITPPEYCVDALIVCPFNVPQDGQHPPPLVLIDELKTVYAADERFIIIGMVTRFVRTPNMRDVSKGFDPVRDSAFVKTFAGRPRFGGLGGAFDKPCKGERRKGIVFSSGWNKPGVRVE